MSDITRDYSFGGWLRAERLKKQLTLRTAANRLGMDAGNYSKLERGELEPPRKADKVIHICEELGLSNPVLEILLSTAYQHHLSRFKLEFFQ